MGLLTIRCDVCNGTIFHGGGLAGHAGSKSVKCHQCGRTMCAKCNKGPLCIECFTTASAEIQESCEKARKLVKYIIFIDLGLMFIPMLGIFLALILNIDLGENGSLMAIMGIPAMIGFVGLCPALIFQKAYFKIWHNKHHESISSHRVKEIDRPSF